jgi:hypothetical protein
VPLLLRARREGARAARPVQTTNIDLTETEGGCWVYGGRYWLEQVLKDMARSRTQASERFVGNERGVGQLARPLKIRGRSSKRAMTVVRSIEDALAFLSEGYNTTLIDDRALALARNLQAAERSADSEGIASALAEFEQFVRDRRLLKKDRLLKKK